MNAVSIDYAQLLRAWLPELSLVVGALAVLGVDLGALRGKPDTRRLRVATVLGMIACAAGLVLTWRVGAMGSVLGGALMLDALAAAARSGVLVLTIFALAAGVDARVSRNPAEYVAVMLFAATGLSVMTAAQQLLLVFVALELASLSLYILVGFDKTRRESAEAALKYFLFGGMSAAFLLFGFSLLYGLTGSLDVSRIGAELFMRGPSPLLGVALVMVVVAFGFKAAAAPFHLWAPDAYQGAPAPSAALIASASKLAGVVLFLRLFWSSGAADVGGPPVLADGWWMPVVALVAGASLLLGNLVALAQVNVRRLLAYSAIGHAGVLLLGVIVAHPPFGPAPVLYYAFTYGLATVGAFGVIGVLDRAGGCQRISDLAGLYRRSPLLTVCLFVFVLSLAGIPPLAGFFAKFQIFAAALKLGGLASIAGWLAVAAILLSAVALYYYLIVLKHAVVMPPGQNESNRVRISFVPAAALITAALAIIGLGVWPSLISRLLSAF